MSGQRKGRKRMRSGLFLPLFDPLADPAVVARVAREAEEAGWDGIFLWARVGALREEAGRAPDEPYEVIAELEPGTDPAPYREAGATWWLTGPDWEGISVDEVRGVIQQGPGEARHGNDEEAIR
jgi:hypothetical protein